MAVEAGTVSIIAESWSRCREAGLCPERCEVRRLPADEARRRLGAGGSVLHASVLQARGVSRSLGETPHAVCVSDADGILVCISACWERAADFGVQEGCDWSEPHRGTNAVGTAIAADGPVVCSGADHFLRDLHDIDGVGVPVHGPDGRIAGSLALFGPRPSATPERAALLALAARVVERGPAQYLPALVAALRDRLTTLVLNMHEYRRTPDAGLLDTAVGSGRKLSALLDRIAECREPWPEMADAATMLRAAAERVRPEAMRRGVGIEIAAAEGLEAPARLEGAVRSILEAAIRATGPGAIRVEAGREGLRVRLAIRAPGGIYVFDAGYQLSLHEIEAQGGEVRVRPGLVDILI